MEQERVQDGPPRLIRLRDSDLKLPNPDDDIRHCKVVERNGEEIGEVDDLLIDSEARKVRFFKMGRGGILGLGREEVFVPIDAVSKVEKDRVTLRADRGKIAAAPRYDPKLEPEWEQISGYYGYEPFWGAGYVYPPYPYFSLLPMILLAAKGLT